MSPRIAPERIAEIKAKLLERTYGDDRISFRDAADLLLAIEDVGRAAEMEAVALDELMRHVLGPDAPKLRLSLAKARVDELRSAILRIEPLETRLAAIEQKLGDDEWFDAMNAVLEAARTWRKWNATRERWSVQELHLSDCVDGLREVEARLRKTEP